MHNIPSRKEWRGFYPEGVTKVSVFPMIMFGWKGHRHFMPAGTKLNIFSSGELSRSNAPNRALHTMGKIVIVDEAGDAGQTRVPGTFTPECPDILPGTNVLTAVEDSEFWCFNYIANRKALPNMTPIRLNDSSEANFPAGSRVFICKGEFVMNGQSKFGPLILPIDEALSFKAVGEVYGLVFERDRKYAG